MLGFRSSQFISTKILNYNTLHSYFYYQKGLTRETFTIYMMESRTLICRFQFIKTIFWFNQSYILRNKRYQSMDPNMQEILYEEEVKYQSRNTPPGGSSPGFGNDSPNHAPGLDSVIYYEQPDSPKHRKKIFDPLYKNLQHSKHMRRLQREAGYQSSPMQGLAQDNLERAIATTVAPGAQQFFSGISQPPPQNPMRNSTENQLVSEMLRRTAQPIQRMPILDPMGTNQGNVLAAKMVASMDPSAPSNGRIENVFESARNGQNPMNAVATDAVTRSRINDAAMDLAKAGKIMSAVESDIRNDGNSNPMGAFEADLNRKVIGNAVAADMSSKVLGNAVAADLNQRVLGSAIATDMSNRVIGSAVEADLNRQALGSAVAADLNQRVLGNAISADMTSKVLGDAVIDDMKRKSLMNAISSDIHRQSLREEQIGGTPLSYLSNDAPNQASQTAAKLPRTNEFKNRQHKRHHEGGAPVSSHQLFKKIQQLQSQINNLTNQLQQAQIKDQIKQQRLQSVLIAKQKEITKKKLEIRRNNERLIELKEIKDAKAAKIENLKLQLESLRRQNDIARRNEEMREEIYWDQQMDHDRMRASFTYTQPGSSPHHVRHHRSTDRDYQWASDRLVNAFKRRQHPYFNEYNRSPSSDFDRSHSRSHSRSISPRERIYSPTLHHHTRPLHHTFGQPQTKTTTVQTKTVKHPIPIVPTQQRIQQIPVSQVRYASSAVPLQAHTHLSQPAYIHPNIAFTHPTVYSQQIPVTSHGIPSLQPTKTLETGPSDNHYRSYDDKSLSFNQYQSFDQSQPSINVRDYDKAAA